MPTFRNTTVGTLGTYSGKGADLNVGEFDGNTVEFHERLLTIETATGLKIVSYSTSAASFTLTFSDSSTLTVPLPILQLSDGGEWLNGTFYPEGAIVSVRGSGIFLVLQPHTTDASPATFDPAATDGTTENNALYRQIGPALDFAYDIAFSVAGLQQRDVPTGGAALLAQYVATRALDLPAGLPLSQAYLDTPTEGTGTDPTALELSIEKNGSEVGTISFATGSHIGTITFSAAVSLAAGDRLALRPLRADDAAASDLSATIAAQRADI